MAVTKYSYSIEGDTLNGAANIGALNGEISSSSIVTAVDRINSSEDILDIYMKDVLSAGDIIILNALVSDHTGASLGDEEITLCDIVEQVSNAVSYRGECLSAGASTSDYIWRISRKVVRGKTTSTVRADMGRFTQQWDAKESIFSNLELNNEYSTLFDGINDYISFGNTHNFDNATAFSLSFWIRANNFSAQRGLWTKVSNDANVFGWGLYHNNAGKLFLQARASGQLRSFTFNTAMTAGTWYHITMTYSGNQNINGIRCYINSEVENTPSSGTLTNTLINTGNSTFGSRNSSFFYSGYMTQINFFDKELSASEVETIHNSGTPGDPTIVSFSDNLINYYKLGDGDALPTALDSAGTVNGTFTNFSTVSTDVFKEVIP